MNRRNLLTAGLGLLVLATAAPLAAAQSFSPGGSSESPRNANIVPLREVFARLKSQYGGYQLDAELFSTSGGGSEYRIDWMSGDGRRMRIVVNAQNGRVIRASGG